MEQAQKKSKLLLPPKRLSSLQQSNIANITQNGVYPQKSTLTLPVCEDQQRQKNPVQASIAIKDVDPKKIHNWREGFKNLTFYFDGIEPTASAKLRADILKMGAKFEQFLSYKVSHIVTGNPDFLDNYKTEDGIVPDIKLIADKLEVKLWSDRKLKSVLEAIMMSPPTNALLTNGSLKDALRKEKMFGLSTNKINMKFKQFKEYYVLVEELTGLYKPIIALEYSKSSDINEPPWPVIRFENHSSMSAFAPKTEISERFTSSERLDSEIVSMQFIYSNASGIPSVMSTINSTTSRTTSQHGVNNVSAIERLKSKTILPSVIPTKRARDEEPVQSECQLTSVTEKPGFCENCNTKYKNFNEHVSTKKHRKYATHEKNFSNLDKFFKKLGNGCGFQTGATHEELMDIVTKKATSNK